MKTNKFYYFSLLLCTLALGFTSCEKEEEEDDFDTSALYGDWMATSTEYKEYLNGELIDEEYFDESDDGLWGIRFTKNGEWYSWEEYYGDINIEYGGTYSCKDGKLKVYSEEDNDSETITIKTLTSKKLVLMLSETYSEDGDKYKYVEIETFEKVDIE